MVSSSAALTVRQRCTVRTVACPRPVDVGDTYAAEFDAHCSHLAASLTFRTLSHRCIGAHLGLLPLAVTQGLGISGQDAYVGAATATCTRRLEGFVDTDKCIS